uniref:Uncharacterized protein n=1 Tax=Anguilla anguilla TaxID=7936 RepID=A0A0E9VQL9_ANGAN
MLYLTGSLLLKYDSAFTSSQII